MKPIQDYCIGSLCQAHLVDKQKLHLIACSNSVNFVGLVSRI